MAKKVAKKRKTNQSKNGFKQTMFHWFVPHKDNKFHPHAIRWQSLLATAAVSLLMHIIYTYTTTGQVAILGKTTVISSSEMLDITNEQRLASKLEPFFLDPMLSQAAELKVKDMVDNNYWSHVSPSGLSPWSWIDSVGYKYVGAGENLAKNYPDENSILNAWMASSDHRDNILNADYKAMGVASAQDVVNGKLTTIVVAYYAQPSDHNTAGSVLGGSTGGIQDKKFVSYNNPLTYLGSTIKNMSPVSLGVLSIAVMLGFISLVSFIARSKLPKEFSQSWHRHHALYKAISMSVVVILLLVFSSGVTI